MDDSIDERQTKTCLCHQHDGYIDWVTLFESVVHENFFFIFLRGSLESEAVVMSEMWVFRMKLFPNYVILIIIYCCFYD